MATPTSTFLSTLQTAPHDFLQPSLPLYTDAVAYLKNILDPLASQISQEQQQRLKEARKKRKRGHDVADENVLRLSQIHTDGFGVEQVWEQAKRVIDAAREEAGREYEQVQELQAAQDGHASVRSGEDEDIDDEELGEEGSDFEVEGVDDRQEEYDEEEHENEGLEDQILEDDDEADFDTPGHDDYDDLEEDEHRGEETAAEFVADKFGLNDGFFSIDDFNKQSEFLEQQDARGDNDGAASDEDDVDWDADPLNQAVPDAQAHGVDDGGDSTGDDEDGPAFGDPDAPSEDEDGELGDGELDAVGGMGNTNDVMYADFFAPPAQKKKKNKKGRPIPHNFPEASAKGKEEEEVEDMERTIAAVHRDLFDESDEEEDDEEGGDLDPGDPRSRRSTHERRKAELQEQIRKLEAANVAKREWTLSGEARAADRPMNSLLEEDLDFERAGKPIPVVTAEVSETIEELIKRRILAHDFQNVVRRRPDDLATGKDGRRGKLDFVLDDGKSKKGLAEEYEEEHLRRTDPDFVDVKDERLQKQQKEIESLWKEVCGQLDSLSSWHFRPKQPMPQLDIRVDAPVVTMEDARPTTGGEVASASQLAPQEVYKAGEAVDKRAEVVGKSGLPASREELSREERKRRRRREKERIHKAGTNGGSAKTESRTAREKKSVLGDLKRGNVKVIGRKGNVTDVEGKKVGGNDSGQGAARFKL